MFVRELSQDRCLCEKCVCRLKTIVLYAFVDSGTVLKCCKEQFYSVNRSNGTSWRSCYGRKAAHLLSSVTNSIHRVLLDTDSDTRSLMITDWWKKNKDQFMPNRLTKSTRTEIFQIDASKYILKKWTLTKKHRLYNDFAVNTRVTHLAGHGRRWRPKIGIVKARFSHPEMNTQGL